MTRTEYYENMKARAREVRLQHGLATPRVQLSDMRRIYKHEGIRIDLWEHKLKHLRGAYFNDENGTSVLIDKKLPIDPRVFTLAHELKHHLVDRHLPISYCDPSNENEVIEIGAEVFAAELIFPEGDFVDALMEQGVGKGACRPEDIVRLKRETQTTLSYAGLAKRAAFLGFATAQALAGTKWKKLEEELYGEPVYKRIARRRRSRR